MVVINVPTFVLDVKVDLWLFYRRTSGLRKISEVCVVAVPFILDVRLVDAPAGVAQEEGHRGSLHLPSAVLALIFIARRLQPSLSLVDRDVEFRVPTS